MSLSIRNSFAEIKVATDTVTVLGTTSAVFIRPSSESVLLTSATDTGAPETLSRQSRNWSPSKSLCGRDRAQLKHHWAIFLFFLMSESSPEPLSLSFSLSFSQLLRKIPSINATGGVTYKYTN